MKKSKKIKTKSEASRKESASERRRKYFRIDMRWPALGCAAEAVIFFIAYAILCTQITEGFAKAALAFAAVYVVTAGLVLLSWSARYKKISDAEAESRELNTEIYDMFRYIIDIPYAVVSSDGIVKVINGALQDILGFRTATCNIDLGDFCEIPIKRITESARNADAYVQNFVFTLPPEPSSDDAMITKLNDGRQYEVVSYIMRLRGENYYFLVFNDVNDYAALSERMEKEAPVVGYIALDNLQELTQFVRANYREAANRIETILGDWARQAHALLREYDRDKYVFFMSRENLDMCINNRFDILDKVMAVEIGDNSFPVSISMGIAAIDGTMEQRDRAAYSALDVALQRGGNQVALRWGADNKLDYFGGAHKTIEANTTISSRVAVKLLADKIANAGNVLIMGHSNPDFDAIGACVGAARLAMCASESAGRTTDVKIIANKNSETFRICYEQLSVLPEYEDMFINREEGLDLVRSDTLLIIVDVNNPRIFESPDLPFKVSDIALIDHHILTGELTFDPFLNYIEATKSSASEIIAEMLEQSPWEESLKKEEANVMLSGIMLDTNNFTRNAGAQTFEITHYLYLRGAHTSVTYKFFDEDLDSLHVINEFESRARIYHGNIAITWMGTQHEPSPDDRVAAARAADKLLTVKGVEAAFALVRSVNNTVMISGRSKGEINVQIILEKLEGGGHFDMAGAQIADSTLSGALDLLKDAIDSYFEYDYRKEDK